MKNEIMKNRIIIIIAFVLIAFAMWGVWHFAYKPNFSPECFSIKNSEWGGFGDFFWGLGTMLLTALNVYMVYSINTSIERNRRAKDKFEIEKEIINEYKSLRDCCLKRDSADVFSVDTQYIAQMESFIRELRRYTNVFPFLRDEKKRRSLDILQERLRILQDPVTFDRWKQTHPQDEIDTYNCVMYSHSEWILGYMIADWCEIVNESLNN